MLKVYPSCLHSHYMPRSARLRDTATAPATPAARLRDAKAALETGERRQRAGESTKAVTYFQTVCNIMDGMKYDPHGCLLWASAMESLVELGAPSWNGSSGNDSAPSLLHSWSALERGHAAAVSAGASSDDLSQLLAARAETAELLRESASDVATAVRFASEAARLWEESLTHELDAQRGSDHVPEAAVETLCSLGVASMAYATLALSRGADALDVKSRRSAQAAVKRSLGLFDEACSLCDSSRGDDLPEVLFQWARALWDTSDVVPSSKRLELLEQAIEKATASLRLQQLPLPETACLLGDLLIDLGETAWRQRVAASEADAGAAAVWHLRRALHEGYATAMRVRSHDLTVLCRLADALLDVGRLQRDMAAHGVDVAAQLAAQPTAVTTAEPPPMADPMEIPTPSFPTVPSELPADITDFAAHGEARINQLAEAVDCMQVEPPIRLVQSEIPASLPPLPTADECLERATKLYSDLLERPAAEWTTASVIRNDTVYNAACACALRSGSCEEECARLLAILAAEGALMREEVENDADLSSVLPTAWMQSLLRGL